MNKNNIVYKTRRLGELYDINKGYYLDVYLYDNGKPICNKPEYIIRFDKKIGYVINGRDKIYTKLTDVKNEIINSLRITKRIE